MACSSGASAKPNPNNNPAWRKASWIALVINAAMFVAKMAAGVAGGSKALQADALDFHGDSANYAISLGVAGMALAWRAGRFSKGRDACCARCVRARRYRVGHLERPDTCSRGMGIVGVAALVANAGVAVMLYRFRSGDANMRSVWICSRNDAIGNIAVVLAAAGVFGNGTAWPDLIVAGIMAALGISGGTQIIMQACKELTPKNTGYAVVTE